MNKKFTDFMQKYAGARLAIAVSGGADSVCLLHWCVAMGLDVTALHVNHGLRAAADTETKYVADLCAKLGVPCHTFYWTDDKPSSGLEAAARDARYRFMTDFCTANNIDALLVAHHGDDQIETFLMNLARGSGLAGLSAMQPESVRDGVRVLRPLLSVPRAELVQYCHDNKIKYYIDEMNSDADYTRVRIRQNRHVLSEKLGITDARILLAVENLSRSRRAMDENLAELVTRAMDDGRALFSDSFLFDQPHDIRLKLLGLLIKTVGGDNYQPRLNSLLFALDMLQNDCKFTLGHCTLRRYNGRILIVPEGVSTSISKIIKRKERKERNEKTEKKHIK